MINVEYNQLDSLLRQKWNRNGDIKNNMGYSHFLSEVKLKVLEVLRF